MGFIELFDDVIWCVCVPRTLPLLMTFWPLSGQSWTSPLPDIWTQVSESIYSFPYSIVSQTSWQLLWLPVSCAMHGTHINIFRLLMLTCLPGLRLYSTKYHLGEWWDLIGVAFIPAFLTFGRRDSSLVALEEGMWTELHVTILWAVLFLGFCSTLTRHWFNGNPIHLQEGKRGRKPSALKIYKTLAFGHNQTELSYLTHTHTHTHVTHH